MAIMDDVLRTLVAYSTKQAAAVGLTRTRGGIVRGTAWAEIAGRGTDGTWYELRLHHSSTTRKLQAGLLAYKPLSQGGRSLVVGERTLYADEPLAGEMMAMSITRWLEEITP